MTRHFCDRCNREREEHDLDEFTVYRKHEPEPVLTIVVCKDCGKPVWTELKAVASVRTQRK